jgi:DMSO/TMAO reductase YedYZ molybdopterin-dependent catalytic subunit
VIADDPMSLDTPTTEPTPPVSSPVSDLRATRRAGWAGAAAAGLALGLAELFAGFVGTIPSAVSAVGSFVVDWSPGFVKRFAIELFGTADKGALAIGTTIIAVLIGIAVGRASLRRRRVPAAVFGVFGIVGIAAGLAQPLINPGLTVIAIGGAAAAGWWVLVAMIHSITAEASPAPTDGLPVDASRRSFAALLTGAGVAAVAGGGIGRSLIIQRSEAAIESVPLPAVATPVGIGPENQFTGVNGLTPIVVPNNEFYRIDTALVVPRPDANTWRMKVTGLVDNEVSLTLDDLLAMELHDRYVTISCVSNEVGGGLVGNALWTGVRLVEVLDQAGVQPEATQIVGRSVDGWTSGFPTEAAYDGRDPIIAVGMNGEPLPARHGFPARLIVPGLYGYVSATKWLSEIELTRWEDFDSYWVPRGWSKEGPIKTQSRIDHPRQGERISAPDAVFAGVAWAPTKGIDRVEIRIDDGPWVDAELTTPLSGDAWVQWKRVLPVEPGSHTVTVRATDGTGGTQTAERSRPDPDGATGHHAIDFRAV